MNRKGQQQIVEWAMTGIVLLILLYVFFQIGKSFCQADSSFCGYSALLVGALVFGIVWFLRYGNRR